MCFGQQESCAPSSVLNINVNKLKQGIINIISLYSLIGMNIAQMHYKVATRLPTSIQPPVQPSLGFVVERSERQRWPKLPQRYLAVPSDQRVPRFRWMRRRQFSRKSSKGAELPHLEGVLGILTVDVQAEHLRAPLAILAPILRSLHLHLPPFSARSPSLASGCSWHRPPARRSKNSVSLPCGS